MATRLQTRIQGCTLRAPPGVGERLDLGMRATRTPMVAAPENAPVFYDDAADGRIGSRASKAFGGLAESDRHPVGIIVAAPARALSTGRHFNRPLPACAP